jgi:hypothetical protein
MGLDLSLLPVDLDHHPSMMCSHTILNLDRNQIVRDIQEVGRLHSIPVPQPLGCYVARQENGERGYGDETHDPYGDPLRYVLAKHLKPIGEKYGLALDGTPRERRTSWDMILEKPGPTEDGYRSPVNRAVMAYVCALPDDFKIVLYWH